MPNVALSFIANNDPLVTFNLFSAPGTPANLTGAVISLYLKTSAAVPDTDASTEVISSATTGSPLVIANATGGVVTMQFTASQFVGKAWYHLDVAINGLVLTYAYGPIALTQV